MSNTSSIPVLRAGRNHDLRVVQGELVLRRDRTEHRIPLAAVARVEAEGRAVRVRLRARPGGEAAEHGIDGVSEVAADLFARGVTAALPPTEDGAEAVDGAALVVVRTLEPEPLPRAKAWGRRFAWAALVWVLVIVAVSVLTVRISTEPGMVVMTVVSGGMAYFGGLFVWFASAELWARVRLPRHGITVTAYQVIGGDPTLYLYGDHEDNTRTHRGTSGRPSVDISYDPRDPERVIEIGSGTAGNVAVLLLLGVPTLSALLMFFATPFI
ncbi:hypothetical protein ACN20G_27965 (plasmid) [Streptomyces sp. BI20]|uniref:hypothetical protein n=1 Tax=Streptomyces sp. BI20 TaxID=3403460 RepID=UPI003C73F8F5